MGNYNVPSKSSQLGGGRGGGGGGGVYFWEFFVGVCRSVLQILTRFETKKCNFAHSISD